MKRTLLTVLAAAPMLGATAIADTTFGIGAGPLYNGLGLNVGRTTGTSLAYGALGCMSFSSSGSESRAGNESIELASRHDTNCGVGAGYVSTTLLPGNRQGLGLNVGFTYDTDEGNGSGGGAEWRLTPSYHYFFRGIDRRGLNLGIGPQAVLRERGSNDVGVTLNLGFQF